MNKIILIKQKLSRSKIFNKFLTLLPRQIILLKPLENIMIEPTNLCNLNCLFCTQSISSRPKGMMSLADFKKILSFLPPTVKEVQLHFAGESMLNQALPEMVKCLKERGVKTVLSSNGTLPFSGYQRVIEAGLDNLIISFDGATKTTYETYRRGGNFDTVVENLKKMSSLPVRRTKIIIQFIVMRHNENEIEAMKKLAGEVGADELWLKSASFNIGCSEILEKDIFNNAKNFLPQNSKYSRYLFKDGKLINKDKPLSCPWIFRTVILWNGDVTVCCVDLEGKAVVGNIFETGSFENIWRSKKYHQQKSKILKNELAICQKCSIGDNPIKERIVYNKK